MLSPETRSFTCLYNYSHVVMKTLAGMRWASEKLNKNDFYSSGDDDMIVNLGRLQESIDKHIEEQLKNSWPEYPIICTYEYWSNGGKPFRNKKNKNYISFEEYKWTEWPKFCVGGMYTTSVSVIKQLFKLSKTNTPLRTDDVWITGILRNILGMPSSMIIFPQPAIAQHRQVYGGKNSPESSTKQFLNYWKTTLQTFSSKSTCSC